MAQPDIRAVRYDRCPQQHLASARQLIAQELPPDERRTYLATRSVGNSIEPPDQAVLTWVALRGSTLVGAIEAICQSGRTAYVRIPATVPGEPDDTCVGLVTAITQQLADTQQTDLAQSMLDVTATKAQASFQAAGYEYVAELLYLLWTAGTEVPPGFPSIPNLRLLPVSQCSPSVLPEVIEATYRETLDCPALDGVRDMQDVLDGYRSVGQTGDRHWMLAFDGQRPVGCLLLAEHPANPESSSQAGTWELVYMGLIPGARGHGWGAALIQRAQQLVTEHQAEHLILAVDAQNRPALGHYLRAGFTIGNRRLVLLKQLAHRHT